MNPFDALLKTAIEDPSKRYTFYKELLNLELVVIGTVQDDNQTLHLKYIETGDELILPVFTSLNKFQAILESKYPYVKIPAKMLLEMVETDIPWVLNPGFDPSKKIISEELETLKDGRILHYFFDQLNEKEKEELLTQKTVELPEGTMDSLLNILKPYKSIKKAYLTHLFNPSVTEQPIPLIALELAEEKAGLEMIKDLYKSINQQLKLPAKIELIALDVTFPLANSIIEHTKPFYTRETIDDLRSMFN
jgi:hypothetical protein